LFTAIGGTHVEPEYIQARRVDEHPLHRGRFRPLPEPDLTGPDTALLVVDVQYGDAHPDYGAVRRMRERHPGSTDYYEARLETAVPVIRRLQDAFRALGREVVHVKIESLTRDGRDRSLEHKSLDIHCPPGSKGAQILEEVAPVGDEVVVTKTCGGVFDGTNLDYVLRNLGIRNLVVCGVVTNGCVEAAVRGASGRGYHVCLVEDACAAWTAELEAGALRVMREVYAKIYTADALIAALGAPVSPRDLAAQTSRTM
jgi:nicotinamidase-related amidase